MSKLRSNSSFVRLFLGRVITNVGDSLYIIGTMWLIYDLTGSAFYTGVGGFLMQLPTAGQFLVGPLVDRWPLRPVLIGTQIVNGLFVLAIPFAAWTGHLSVWIILAVMPVLSFVNQFVYPAQSAALPQIVEDDQLVRANSLFSTAYKGSDVAFNAAGGVLLSLVGATTLFVLDSATFAIAGLLFAGVVVPASDESEETDAETEPEDGGYLDDLREGIRYLRGSVVLLLMSGMMVVNVGSGAIMAVLPAFADTIGGSSFYGLLAAALAAGPLVGAASASLFEDYSYGIVAIVGFFCTALALVSAVVIGGLIPTLILFFAAFVPVGVTNVMYSSMLQSTVDESVLGRVSSVSSSASMVMLPFGSLLGGGIADIYGSSAVFLGLAGLQLVVAMFYLADSRIVSLPSVTDASEGALGLGASDEP